MESPVTPSDFIDALSKMIHVRRTVALSSTPNYLDPLTPRRKTCLLSFLCDTVRHQRVEARPHTCILHTYFHVSHRFRLSWLQLVAVLLEPTFFDTVHLAKGSRVDLFVIQREDTGSFGTSCKIWRTCRSSRSDCCKVWIQLSTEIAEINVNN